MPSVPTRFQHLVETLLLHDFLYMLTCYDYANDLYLLIGIITSTMSSYSHPIVLSSDSEASPPTSPDPIHRNRKIRQLQPYEANSVISPSSPVIPPPESVVPPPLAPPVLSLPPPTIFYQ